MLYETPPDRFDGHMHQVELDENGDGLSSEDGPYPHVHEVQGGVVLEARMDNYVSDHPGDLVPAEGMGAQMGMMGQQQAMGPPTMGPGPGGGAGGMPMMGGGMGMGESVLDRAVRSIVQEKKDPLEIVEALLLG